LNSNTNLRISRYLALITHDAAMSVNSSIFAGVYFCSGDFLCFAGTNFLRLGQIGFSRWELIFAIFRKYPVPSIDNIFVFIDYVQ